MPDSEVLDARIGSALNRMIHNSHSKKKGQSGGNKRPRKRIPSRQTDCHLDLRSLHGHWEP